MNGSSLCEFRSVPGILSDSLLVSSVLHTNKEWAEAKNGRDFFFLLNAQKFKK